MMFSITGRYLARKMLKLKVRMRNRKINKVACQSAVMLASGFLSSAMPWTMATMIWAQAGMPATQARKALHPTIKERGFWSASGANSLTLTSWGHGSHLRHASHRRDHAEPHDDGHPDDARGATVVQSEPVSDQGRLPGPLHDGHEAYDAEEALRLDVSTKVIRISVIAVGRGFFVRAADPVISQQSTSSKSRWTYEIALLAERQLFDRSTGFSRMGCTLNSCTLPILIMSAASFAVPPFAAPPAPSSA
ncbi:hypothetical protein LTR53_016030 [Teratosphaeriaceae sp. CCFEE 6253]|nr:hypothetical protein LTR53_016030 [Teratosphaeriaceae sp. CCFEE 6253]